MNNEFACKFMAFKGDDEYVPEKNVLVEITDIKDDGGVEIAFNAPFAGKPRIYLTIDIGELVSRAVRSK